MNIQRITTIAVTASVLALASVGANASAIHDAGQFTTNFPGNDDSSVGPVGLGFNINFFGSNYNQTYVNNNGNVTFTGALSTYTPFGITGVSTPMLAPFFADVDTRVGNITQYGTGVIGGHNVFGVNWIDVGYYSGHTDLTNSFQLIITDRSDTGAGNFDFEFNYDRVIWNTGDASGGTGGLGGVPAAVGWTNGTGSSEQLAGSLIDGALLDGGSNALIHDSRLSSTDGQYVWQVRNGVVEPRDVPEPGSLALLGLGLAGLTVMRKRKQN